MAADASKVPHPNEIARALARAQRSDKAFGARRRHKDNPRTNWLWRKIYYKEYRQRKSEALGAKALKEYNEGVNKIMSLDAKKVGMKHYNIADETALSPLEILMQKEEQENGNSIL